MNSKPEQLNLDQWEVRYKELKKDGLHEPLYGGPLRRHVDDGDLRLLRLKFDNSSESLRLWNFLLTEEDRLKDAKRAGKKLVGTMKDLGTVPVLTYSFENLIAFYPDGAWWIPCVMELNAGLLNISDSLGIDETFCPVRAMLGAFINEAHFPIPDLLICSVGAVCDDFSAIAQRVAGLGHPIMWWEIPHRRKAEIDEEPVLLPGGFTSTRLQISLVEAEILRIRKTLENLSGKRLDEVELVSGIEAANNIRQHMAELRHEVFSAKICPLPALEMLIAEMLAIHYCSDRGETLNVITDLLQVVKGRIAKGEGYFGEQAVRVFWVNPVADLAVMNLLEQCGGRICGTEYLFTHALDLIPTDMPPIEALARTALADPMVGSARDRADRIMRDMVKFRCEALIVSKIPGASHCATEGAIIADVIHDQYKIPILEIEVPPLSDSLRTSLETRISALIEIAKQNRNINSPNRA
ncbi:MAG: 2-hydroxyacyl-CoA dehydratase [Proteobacteria bacterium]|nr:2-hydroxyacyl-CoA dehydratase [Pseudomonadota bacterium]